MRNPETCIHCGRCDAVCHAFARVEGSKTVNDTECDGCMECVKACPAPNCLEAKALGRVVIAPWVWAALVLGVWFAVYGFAYVTGNWKSPIPAEQFKAAVQSGVLERPSVPQ